jgi:hypothetical protein
VALAESRAPAAIPLRRVRLRTVAPSGGARSEWRRWLAAADREGNEPSPYRIVVIRSGLAFRATEVERLDWRARAWAEGGAWEDAGYWRSHGWQAGGWLDGHYGRGVPWQDPGAGAAAAGIGQEPRSPPDLVPATVRF